MIKKIFSIFYLIGSVVFCFEIDDTTYDRRLDGDQPGYKEFKIINRSSSVERYKLEINHTGKGRDISKNLIVTPKILAVNPYSEGSFKIFGSAKEKLPMGVYDFELKITPVVIPALQKSEKGKIMGSSAVRFVPLLEMQAYTGTDDFKKKIKLENIKIEKNKDTKDKDKKYILTATLKNDSYIPRSLNFSYIAGINDTSVGNIWAGRFEGNKSYNIKLYLRERIKAIKIYDSTERYSYLKRVDIN